MVRSAVRLRVSCPTHVFGGGKISSANRRGMLLFHTTSGARLVYCSSISGPVRGRSRDRGCCSRDRYGPFFKGVSLQSPANGPSRPARKALAVPSKVPNGPEGNVDGACTTPFGTAQAPSALCSGPLGAVLGAVYVSLGAVRDRCWRASLFSPLPTAPHGS